jgi:hypothetical protein
MSIFCKHWKQNIRPSVCVRNITVMRRFQSNRLDCAFPAVCVPAQLDSPRADMRRAMEVSVPVIQGANFYFSSAAIPVLQFCDLRAPLQTLASKK